MKKLLTTLFALLIIASCLPQVMFASTDGLQFSGWIPYWAKTAGVQDVNNNISHLDSVSPFSYRVDSKGNLLDLGKKDSAPWTDLYKKAKRNDVTVIPTILWGGSPSMLTVLSDTDLRKEHIKQIDEQILKDKRFAGVDIDYEGKTTAMREPFSLFLTELSKKVHNHDKVLVCTIESRTPIEDRFPNPNDPRIKQVDYSNDFKVIGDVCDEVRIMAYDQGGIDANLLLKKRTNSVYSPIADVEWVEKVIKLALLDIPAEKLHLGIPSYGYMYNLTLNSSGKYDYKRAMAINYPSAMDTAKMVKVKPKRNAAGELAFNYPAVTTSSKPKIVTLVSVSDSEAMLQKVELAKKYNLAGVSIFKFDGEHDEKFWDVIDTNKY